MIKRFFSSYVWHMVWGEYLNKACDIPLQNIYIMWHWHFDSFHFVRADFESHPKSSFTHLRHHLFPLFVARSVIILGNTCLPPQTHHLTWVVVMMMVYLYSGKMFFSTSSPPMNWFKENKRRFCKVEIKRWEGAEGFIIHQDKYRWKPYK